MTALAELAQARGKVRLDEPIAHAKATPARPEDRGDVLVTLDELVGLDELSCHVRRDGVQYVPNAAARSLAVRR